ncbi:MAG: exodeoxyribonuclease III, partial [Mesorhizobium sp.]
MPFTIATWNINSVRLRMPIVERLLKEHAPDVLCLQETKVPDELFPEKAFRKAGYEHILFHGQKGYHGVATVARRPIELVEKRRFCEIEDSRHLSATVQAGGKSRHKLDFVHEMNSVPAGGDELSASILVGDLNIAPQEHDVWSHKQLLNVVSHTPVETTNFEAMRKAGGWVDLMRLNVPAEKKLYTWWSYRAKDWEASNRGRRLDHVWSSAN